MKQENKAKIIAEVDSILYEEMKEVIDENIILKREKEALVRESIEKCELLEHKEKEYKDIHKKYQKALLENENLLLKLRTLQDEKMISNG